MLFLSIEKSRGEPSAGMQGSRSQKRLLKLVFLILVFVSAFVPSINGQVLNPQHLASLVGTGAQLHNPRMVTVINTTAYVLSETTLSIIDVSTPGAPIPVGVVDIENPVTLTVSGNFAYIANYDNSSYGLIIIDVTVPSSPVTRGTIKNGTSGAVIFDPTSISVAGAYAYLTNGSGALEIVDVSNPDSPSHSGVLVDSNWLSYANSVSVAGNFAYVTAAAGLSIVDVSNPLSPVFTSHMTDGTGGAILNNLASVFVSGNYAYVTNESNQPTDGNNVLEIIDISNATSPTLAGKIANGSGGALLYMPVSVCVVGNVAYIASQQSQALEIIDVSNPTNPVHSGSITDGSNGAVLSYPISVSVSGNYAYVIGNSDALEIINVSSSSNPTQAGKIIEGDGGNGVKLVQANGVFVSGNYAYLTSYKSLEIVDVSDPTNPQHAGAISDGDGGAVLGSPVCLFVQGNYAYVGNTEGILEIIDISIPTSPRHVGSLENLVLFNPTSIFVANNYAYVASESYGAIDVVDVSNPAAPWFTGALQSPLLFNPRSVFVLGNELYILNQGALIIANLNNPTTPVVQGTIVNGQGGAVITGEGLFVAGSFAYLANDGNAGGIEVVDVSDPTHPIHAGGITTGMGGSNLAELRSISLSSHYAISTSLLTNSLQIVDVSNPHAPVFAGAVLNGQGGAKLNTPLSVFAAQNNAYVASNGSSALEIIDLYATPAPTINAPVITSVSPTTVTAGMLVTISGSGFDPTSSNNSVYLGRAKMPIVSSTATQIIVRVPKSALNDYITLYSDGHGTSFPIRISVMPAISNFNPAVGQNGEPMTIYGSGFETGCTVQFNNPSGTLTQVLSQTDSTINLVIPDGALTGPITVTNPSLDKAVSTTNFVSRLYFRPSDTTSTIGNEIELYGYGFDYSNTANNIVAFNGTQATILANYPGQLVVQVPAGATSGSLSLSVSGQVVSRNFIILPDVITVSTYKAMVGQVITLTGTGFNLPTASYRADFNGVSTGIDSVSKTSITIIVPVGARTGNFTLTENGRVVLGTPINFQIIPTVKSVTPSSIVVGDIVVIRGTGFDPIVDQVQFYPGFNISVLSATDSLLTCIVPHGAQTGPLNVIPYYQTSSVILTIIPTVVDFSPTSIVAGSIVTLTIDGEGLLTQGANFVAPDSVIFNPGVRAAATCSNWDCTTITVQVPDMTTTGPIRVKVGNQIAVSTTNFIVIKDTIPPITSFTTKLNQVVEGSPYNKMQVEIDDNAQIKTASIYYRGKSQLTWKSQTFSINWTNSLLTFQVDDTWYDALGLEYYISAVDPSGNVGRVPYDSSYFSVDLINAAVSIPNIPFGNKKTDYRIISFPYVLESGTSSNLVSNVLKNIVDNPVSGELFEYAPGADKSDANGYLSYASGTFDTLLPGSGYWILTKEHEVSNRVPNIPSPDYDKKKLFKMALKPNWNLIGNPYPIDISWSDVLAFNGNSNIQSLATYKGGWQVSDTLQAFAGAFVFNAGTTTDTLLIPFRGQKVIGGRDGKSSFGTDISTDSWKLFLNIFQGGNYDMLGGFGMYPIATNGCDAYDVLNPPKLEQSPEINFHQNETQNLPISSDIVRSAKSYVWHFTADAPGSESIQLMWNDNIEDGSGASLYLYDETRMSVINMLKQSEYAFEPGGNNRFSIYYGQQIEIVPEALNVGSPYPNPVLSDKRVNIDLALPSSKNGYTISLKIFNAFGVEVDAKKTTMQSGLQTFKHLFSPTITSGLYLYQISVETTDSVKVFSGKIIMD